MRKWREKSNVFMSYLKKIGIWIKMKKKQQTNLCISAQRKIKLMFIFWGHTMPIYYMYVYYVRMLLCTVGLKGFAWISIFDNFVYSSIMIIDISQNKTE